MITLDSIPADAIDRIAAARAALAEPNGKQRELEARAAGQGKVVQGLQQQLKVAEGVDLATLDDPDQIHAAKLRTAQLRDDLDTETRLLQSIEHAIQNVRESSRFVAGEVGHLVSRTVLDAALEAEPSAIQAFNAAAFELLACYTARHGGAHAIGAMERAFDLAVRDPDHVRRINQHHAELKASLSEGV